LSPSFSKALRSVFGPIAGSSSSFQSPVCSTVPSGVVIASDTGSGMEWVTVTVSISNGPAVNLLAGLEDGDVDLRRARLGLRLGLQQPAVNAVA
jgi:hypothetical protein